MDHADKLLPVRIKSSANNVVCTLCLIFSEKGASATVAGLPEEIAMGQPE
jgi:hypothetical protein